MKIKLIDIRNDLQGLTNDIRTFEKRADFTMEAQRLVDELDIFLDIEKGEAGSDKEGSKEGKDG